MSRKLILFELNEVPPRIVDDFRRRYPRSCLARLHGRMTEAETFAEDAGHLSPWITWPTLHRGVANTRHGIFAFGQDQTEVNREFPNVWEVAQRHGVSTGVCGSLHSYTADAAMDRYAFYLPDTFAAGSECFPKRLSAFQEFNLAMARESARNVARTVLWKSALRMLLNSPSLGLRVGTLADVGRQIVDERFNPARVVRRRTYQGVLAFDVFYKQLRRTEPRFVTFFTNHVASAMHRYWAAQFPGDYAKFGFDHGWVHTYGNEIDFAMRKFDRSLERLVRFVDRRPEYMLWVATSMGQAATHAEPVNAELQVTDLATFMAALNMPTDGWERRPAMVPQVNVFVRPELREAFAAALAGVSIDGRPLDYAQAEAGFFSITVGLANPREGATTVCVGGRAVAWHEMGMSAVPISDRTGVTAYHIPQGLLLQYDPRAAGLVRSTSRSRISTLDVAPQILQRLDVPVPDYMRKPAALAA